jgi:transposase
MPDKASPKQDATSSVYVGMDVCKDWLDAQIHPQGQSRRVSNDKSGTGRLSRLPAPQAEPP